MRTYTIKPNKQKRTYTIRVYDNGVLTAKYRSNPQTAKEFTENWTHGDIASFLKHSNDYYLVK